TQLKRVLLASAICFAVRDDLFAPLVRSSSSRSRDTRSISSDVAPSSRPSTASASRRDMLADDGGTLASSTATPSAQISLPCVEESPPEEPSTSSFALRLLVQALWANGRPRINQGTTRRRVTNAVEPAAACHKNPARTATTINTAPAATPKAHLPARRRESALPLISQRAA